MCPVSEKQGPLRGGEAEECGRQLGYLQPSIALGQAAPSQLSIFFLQLSTPSSLSDECMPNKIKHTAMQEQDCDMVHPWDGALHFSSLIPHGPLIHSHKH